jgi:hypothetical protein
MPKFEVEVIDEADGSSRWVPVHAADAAAARDKVNSYGEVVGRARLLAADDAAPAPLPTAVALAPAPATVPDAFPSDIFNHAAKPAASVERTLLTARPSMLGLLPIVIGWSPFIAIAAAGYAADPYAAEAGDLKALLACCVLMFTFLLRKYAYLSTSTLLVTTQRVRFVYGGFGRTVVEMPISKVESVTQPPCITGILFGYGHIRLSGSGSTVISARRLHNPEGVYKAINEALQAARK